MAPLAIVLLVGAATTTADAGPEPPTLKISRQANGPYTPSIAVVNIPEGKTKTLYFKVKNPNASPISFTLEGESDFSIDSYYRIKWFRGSKNITEKMTDGFLLELPAGDQKQYSSRIKHLPDTGNLEFCFSFVATGSFTDQTSFAGINGLCP